MILLYVSKSTGITTHVLLSIVTSGEGIIFMYFKLVIMTRILPLFIIKICCFRRRKDLESGVGREGGGSILYPFICFLKSFKMKRLKKNISNKGL